MINLHQLKSGDSVITNFGGVEKPGKIIQVDHIEKKVLVATENDNEFWYDLDSLHPIHLTPETLLKLQFHVDESQSGQGKGTLYVRGPFSVRWFPDGHEPLIVLHYRDESRQLTHHITLNELQNHYHGMTNFHLE